MAGLDSILGAAGGVGSLLQGIGSIFDLTGSNSSKDLAEQQLQLQQFAAQIGLNMAQAGQTNARGDKLFYDRKNRQWVVQPSPRTQQMIAASDAAQMAGVEHDAPLARIEAEREMAARGRESQAADAALTRYGDYNPITPDRLASDMYTSAASGLKEGYNQVAGDVARQAIRGGTGGGALLDQLDRSYARDLGNARVNSRLNALTQSGDINRANRGSLLDEATKLRAGAAGIPTITSPSDTLSNNLSSILNSSRAGAIGGIQGLGNVANQGYSNLIGQNTNYYQDLGMAGNDLVTGLGALTKQLFGSDPTAAATTTPTSTQPQAQRAGF